MKKTQYDLIFKWFKKHKSITPAKVGGTTYYSGFFGSEISRRCRELRSIGILDSFREVLPTGRKSRFVTFILTDKIK